MELLIKTTENLSDFINVSDDFNMENLRPGLIFAEREYIHPILGKATCDRLKSDDAAVNGLEDIDKELLSLIHPPLVLMAFLEMADEFDVAIGTGGIAVNVGENQVIASQQRVYNLKKSYFSKAQRGFDQLINFLLEKGDEIDVFDGSDEQVALNNGFIANAIDLKKFISWPVSHYAFTLLRPITDQIQENEILPILCKPLCDLLLQGKIAGGQYTMGGVNYSPILPLVQKAMAFRLIQYAVKNSRINISHDGVFLNYVDGPDSVRRTEPTSNQLNFQIEVEFKNKADQAFGALKKHLNANRSTYVLWASSDCAQEVVTNTIKNTSGKGIHPLFGV